MTYASRNTTPDPTRSAASDVGDNVQALREDIASLAASVKRLAAEQMAQAQRQRVRSTNRRPSRSRSRGHRDGIRPAQAALDQTS